MIFSLTHEQSRGAPRRRISDQSRLLNESSGETASEKHEEIKKFESKELAIDYDLISNFDSFGCGLGSSDVIRQSSNEFNIELAKLNSVSSELVKNGKTEKEDQESKKRTDESLSELKNKKMKLNENSDSESENEDLVIDADVSKEDTPKKSTTPTITNKTEESMDMGPASPTNDIAEPDEIESEMIIPVKMIPLEKELKKPIVETPERQKQTPNLNKSLLFSFLDYLLIEF